MKTVAYLVAFMLFVVLLLLNAPSENTDEYNLRVDQYRLSTVSTWQPYIGKLLCNHIENPSAVYFNAKDNTYGNPTKTVVRGWDVCVIQSDDSEQTIARADSRSTACLVAALIAADLER